MTKEEGAYALILTVRFSPELCISLSLSLSDRGRREDRALAAPAYRVQWVVKNAHGFDRYSRDIPAFPAQWLYGLYVLSPVSGVVCHRRGVGLTTRLTPRSRRQDHTISPYAAAFSSSGRSRLTPQASIATRTTLRDERVSSLMAARAEWANTVNRNYCKAEYFSSRGLTQSD